MKWIDGAHSQRRGQTFGQRAIACLLTMCETTTCTAPKMASLMPQALTGCRHKSTWYGNTKKLLAGQDTTKSSPILLLVVRLLYDKASKMPCD